MEWFKAKGKIIYDPKRVGGRKRVDMPWVIVEVPESISYYYRNVVDRYVINPFRQTPTPTHLAPPMWGTHISVLDGRHQVPNMNVWNKYNNQVIEFEYSNDIEQHWKFFVLPVRSEFLVNLIDELGVKHQKRLHITIGRIDD